MTNFKIFSTVAIVLLSCSLTAQVADNNDTEVFTHSVGLQIKINVPVVANLGLYDNTSIQGLEGDLLGIDKLNKQGVYLNYTSVTGNSESNTIYVSISGTIPSNSNLKIVLKTPQLSNLLQRPEYSIGVVDSSEILLGLESTDNQTVPIVNGIRSVQTGHGAYGVGMTYSLVEKKTGANYTSYESEMYNPSLTYTFSAI